MTIRCVSLNKITFIIVGIITVFIAFALTCYTYVAPIKYSEFVDKYSLEYHVEKELVYAVIRAESSFNPHAVSSAGAVGLMQIMPSTAEFIRRNIKSDVSLYCVEGNVRMGCWYLAYLGRIFSEKSECIAAYNAGEGSVKGWLKNREYLDANGRLKVIPFPETKKYVERVKLFYKFYKYLYF